MSKKLFPIALWALAIIVISVGIWVVYSMFLSDDTGHQQALPSRDTPSVEVVVVEEFASLTCPHCGKFHETIVKKLFPPYIESGQINYIYRDFPLDGTALGAAMLAECVADGDNDRYLKFIDVLYTEQNEWLQASDIRQALFGYAALAGLNESDANACLKDETIYNRVIADKKLGDSKGVDATPSIFINGKKLNDFSYDGIKARLDSLLKQ